MTITVRNSRPEAPIVTLFGRLDDGTYTAAVMEETSVPYTPYWENSVDQTTVYIEPTDEQLARILLALNDGRLEFIELQNYGSSAGGTSSIPV